MIKVMFLSWHFETPEIFLNSILKMTPNCSGIWKNIQAVTNPEEADFYIITDGWNQPLPDKQNKAIYFGQHPNTPYSPIDKTFNGQGALLKLPLKSYLNPGEWWIDYTYDELMNMKPFEKTKELICVATYQDHHPMYKQRQIFLRDLVTKHPNIKLDIYGRPQEKYETDNVLKPYYKGVLGNNTYDAVKGEHLTGKNILKQYKYSLEFDVGPTPNYYISERFYDAILLWCIPIYFGCTTTHDFLPPNGHKLIDINDLKNSPSKLFNTMPDLKYCDIKKTRDILLNKYQTWAYTHHVVNHIEEYKLNPEKTFKEWINDY